MHVYSGHIAMPQKCYEGIYDGAFLQTLLAGNTRSLFSKKSFIIDATIILFEAVQSDMEKPETRLNVELLLVPGDNMV